MKKKLIAAILAAAMGTGVYVGVQSQAPSEQLSELQLENIEALSAIEFINGTPYIVDEIPCASSAKEIRVDCSYVSCVDCKKQAGKADETSGKCTEVRTFP